jgi:hypothetical protein
MHLFGISHLFYFTEKQSTNHRSHAGENFCKAKKVNKIPWVPYTFHFHMSNISSTNIINNAVFEVPTKGLLMIRVFWNVTVCCLEICSWNTKGPSAPHDGTTILWNIKKFSPHNTVLHPRNWTQYSSHRISVMNSTQFDLGHALNQWEFSPSKAILQPEHQWQHNTKTYRT